MSFAPRILALIWLASPALAVQDDHEPDPRRPETLVFGGEPASWRPVEIPRSTLRLLPGWKLYPEKLAKDGRAPWLVAARSIDRALGRAVHVDEHNIGSFLDGVEGETSGKVRDEKAAEALFRILADGRLVERAAEGQRALEAARLLASSSPALVARDRAAGIHETLVRWKVRVLAVPRVAWRVRARRVGRDFEVTGCCYRDWPGFALVELRARISREGKVELRRRHLVVGPPAVWSTASIATPTAAEEEIERERRRDVRLVRRRFEAALDSRRTARFAKRLCLGSERLSRSQVITAMGEPDDEIGRDERVLVYGMWDGRVLEFVGNTRIRELRIAEAPRPRTALRDELVSGPAVERVWSGGR